MHVKALVNTVADMLSREKGNDTCYNSGKEIGVEVLAARLAGTLRNAECLV